MNHEPPATDWLIDWLIDWTKSEYDPWSHLKWSFDCCSMPVAQLVESTIPLQIAYVWWRSIAFLSEYNTCEGQRWKLPPPKKKHPWSVSIWRLLGILKLSNQARGRESQQIWFKLLNLKPCVNTQCVQKVFKTPASPQQNRNRHLHAGSAHRILLLRL